MDTKIIVNNVLICTLILIAFYAIFFTLDASSNWQEVKIFISNEDYHKAVIYFTIYWAVLFSLFILIFHRIKKISILTYLLMFLSVTLDYGYRKLNGSGFTYEDALLLKQNIGFKLEGEVIKTYFPEFLYATGIALFSIILIIGLRHIFRTIRIDKKRYLVIPLVVFMAVSYIVNSSIANRLAYPIPYKIPALLFYVGQKGLYSGDRDAVYFSPETKPIAKHIVWIIDESVRADKLQINGFTKATTPFLKSIQDSLLNYGTASSGSVCSDYSHIMLMSGLNVEQLPDQVGLARKKPTIFQYANHAGMQTNLLYAPGHEDEPKGYMTKSDFNHISNRFHTKKIYPEIPIYLIDIQSIDILENIISTQSSSFTYFLKYGCHFHYESTYPPESRYFKPVQDVNYWKRDHKEKLLNSYYNALRWEVDHFFKILYDRFANQDILFIYTSDHGQHLMEYPNLKMTHCIKKSAPKEMAMVPLFLLPMNHRIKSRIDLHFNSANINKASHFNIFPSTLILMGYDPNTVATKYGKTLFDSLQISEQIFISGDIFGRSEMYFNTFK